MKNNRISQQRGMSVWGISGVIVLALVVIWLAIKVMPEYLSASSIETCLKDGYAATNFAKNSDVNSLTQNFRQCLQNNAIYDQAGYTITPQGKTAVLNWNVELGIAGNAYLLLKFSASAPE